MVNTIRTWPVRQRVLVGVLIGLLTLSVAWIATIAAGNERLAPMTPPNTFTIEMRKRLRSDPRFAQVECQIDPSDPGNVMVLGEVPDPQSLDDLRKAINPDNLTLKVNMQVEVVRPAN